MPQPTRKYRPQTTRASTATRSTMELCFLTIFIFRSRNRTRGLAIMATILPITKGMKKTRSLGPQTHTAYTVNTGIKMFKKILT